MTLHILTLAISVSNYMTIHLITLTISASDYWTIHLLTLAISNLVPYALQDNTCLFITISYNASYIFIYCHKINNTNIRL